MNLYEALEIIRTNPRYTASFSCKWNLHPASACFPDGFHPGSTGYIRYPCPGCVNPKFFLQSILEVTIDYPPRETKPSNHLTMTSCHPLPEES